MTQTEFEKMVDKNVDVELFDMFNKWYMACDLTKEEFAKIVKPIVIEKSNNKENEEIIVKIKNKSTINKAQKTTPDWFTMYDIYNDDDDFVKAELIDIDIKTGKAIVKVIPNTYFRGDYPAKYVEGNNTKVKF